MVSIQHFPVVLTRISFGRTADAMVSGVFGFPSGAKHHLRLGRKTQIDTLHRTHVLRQMVRISTASAHRGHVSRIVDVRLQSLPLLRGHSPNLNVRDRCICHPSVIRNARVSRGDETDQSR